MTDEEKLQLLLAIEEAGGIDRITPELFAQLSELGPEAQEAGWARPDDQGQFSGYALYDYLEGTTPQEPPPALEQPMPNYTPPPSYAGGGINREMPNLPSALRILKARKKNPGGINTFD